MTSMRSGNTGRMREGAWNHLVSSQITRSQLEKLRSPGPTSSERGRIQSSRNIIYNSKMLCGFLHHPFQAHLHSQAFC